MTAILSISILTLLILFLLWALMLRPRRHHPGWEKLAHVRYAA